MKNILFYKYVAIEDVPTFRLEQLELCKSLDLKGKILVAKEGINGCLSGEDEKTEAYKKALRADSRFTDIIFKEGIAEEHTFRKVFVKIKEEIITSRFGVDSSQAAPYVEPETLKEWIDDNQVVLLDARNDYECDEGMFKEAINPNIHTFQEWPAAVKKLEHLKDKKIVTYCTGGIRCEKASAYLKSQGFENVYQLHGGILEYGRKTKGAHWDGKCFVFDRRGSVELDPKSQDGQITNKVLAQLPPEQRVLHGKKEIGKVTNYFNKIKVAEVKGIVEEGQKVTLYGPTTGQVDMIAQDVLHHEDGYTTFPLTIRAHKNDIVLIPA